jgi:hypothetical protein
MYKPRPTEERARRVFDSCLDSRLSELSRHTNAAVLLICDSQATIDSFADLPAAYPKLTFTAAVVNPKPLPPNPRDAYAETPTRCEWHDPAGWQRYGMTDRWSRILYALDTARQLEDPGYLIMPAHDAVWGEGLLDMLIALSEQHAKNGLPAAVSPYPSMQHSPVPGVDIPNEIIDALNAAFARASALPARLDAGEYQAFWGKMGMIPFGMCGALLQRVEPIVWEDDLEIDRAIREAGYAAAARYVDDPALYRQALPVFDWAGLRAVIERTLHYSLNIPGDTSILTRPLDEAAEVRRQSDSRFRQGITLAEAITAEYQAEIAERLKRYGASWVDWGAYRHVVRVGDPLVQVWKYEGRMVS